MQFLNNNQHVVTFQTLDYLMEETWDSINNLNKIIILTSKVNLVSQINNRIYFEQLL